MSHRFIDSFIYAAQGIRAAVREERNMRFHLCAAFYVYLFSLFYDFSATQYALLTIMVVGVMALELVNSSIERVVERPAPERYRTAGVVKDMAAGAVLIFSIGCVVAGVFLFWNVKVFKNILLFFLAHPVALIAVLVSFPVAWCFVFRKKGEK